jgi:tripartite-type tricarboxylate transporter receptor subunit TctC
VTYGTPGVGTSLHITMEQIGMERGVQWLHVPYKGSAETSRALLSGEVLSVADSTGWGSFVEAGQFRLLVTWGPERTKRFPQVPTLKELGYGIVSDSPYGIAAPKGTPADRVRIIHDAFKKALDEPQNLALLEKYDQATSYLGPEDYSAFVRKQVAEQKAMIEKLGLKAE